VLSQLLLYQTLPSGLFPYVGKGLMTLQFPDGPTDIMAVPLGDLVEAYYATDIPNVTVYMPFLRRVARFLPIIQIALSIRPLRDQLLGTLTPAQAFGWDFMLGIEGVQLLSTSPQLATLAVPVAEQSE
jgi:hypothetical protein